MADSLLGICRRLSLHWWLNLAHSGVLEPYWSGSGGAGLLTGDADVEMKPSLSSTLHTPCLPLYDPAALPMPAIVARFTAALVTLDRAHVPPTFPRWVTSPTTVTNDDLRPTHLPNAIHRQRACKMQHISTRATPSIHSLDFVIRLNDLRKPCAVRSASIFQGVGEVYDSRKHVHRNHREHKYQNKGRQILPNAADSHFGYLPPFIRKCYIYS
ncbi:hypothetical protein B0H14DRAFT_2614782 [Mycena olivaceomarginata]|nr:hypothetical protein B0H14DRAFT_2614782 [Mycena olivaceomarginata]